MEEDTKAPLKPHKIIIIYDGERPYYAAFADAAQEKRIIEILDERRSLPN